ncbi:MAG: EAL domain-containing protein [Halanaerobiales bacterium]
MAANIDEDLQELMDKLKTKVISFKSNYKVKWANKSAKDFFGFKNNIVGKSSSEVLANKNSFKIDNSILKKVIEDKKSFKEELKSADGETWKIKAYPSENKNKNTAAYMLINNITKPKMMENRLKERSEVFYKVRSKFYQNKEKFESLFLHNPDGICAIDLEGEIISANPALEKITGYKPESMIDKGLLYYIVSEEKLRVKSYLQRASSGIDQEFETIIAHKDGKKNTVSMKIFPMIIEGEINAIYAIIKDITEKKRFEEKLKERAYYDSLTELPNKNYVEEKIDKILEKNNKAAIMFLDVDRFKRINDSLGHNIADKLLKKAAERLNSIIYKGLVARYSGDEFIIILDNINDRFEVEQKLEEIIAAFSDPFYINSRSIFLSFSIGISIYPEDEINKTDLIRYSYLAMYKAKEKSDKSYHFFEAGLIKEKSLTSQKLNMETELRKAIKNNDFILNYQPQIDLYTGKVTGFEALIRWYHEDLGNISPVDFIPLAEETGLIKEVGKWVLSTACRQARIWEEEGFNNIKIAINVSIQQLKDPQFIQDVNNIIKKNNLKPEYIELEITENIMRNLSELEVKLNKLKKIGVQISIDDFGTGYSSLSVLQDLPINTLKIDQSFINNSTINRKSAALVKTIIDMGKNLELDVIAEGIEKKEQVKLLRDNNCRVGQGFLFSKPLPVNDIADIMDFEESGLLIKDM